MRVVAARSLILSPATPEDLLLEQEVLDQRSNRPVRFATWRANTTSSFHPPSAKGITIPGDRGHSARFPVDYLLILAARFRSGWISLQVEVSNLSLSIAVDVLSPSLLCDAFISFMNKFLERGQEVSYGLQACETFLEVG